MSGKIYTYAEMLEWCERNIMSFSEHTGSNPSGITLDVDNQYIYEYYNICIRSNDKRLPFRCVAGTVTFSCPNLSSFDNFPFDNQNIPILHFEDICSLDFNKLEYKNDVELVFTNERSVIPSDLKHLSLSTLSYAGFNAVVTHDLSQYDNLKITKLCITTQYRLKNLSHTIANKNTLERILFYPGFYETYTCERLNDIFCKYHWKADKENYIMDFTVDMIDNGFENEL